MANFKKTILENGLRLITIPHRDALTTTFLVLVEAGSKYETKEINGLSHFLEHMCFKGTKKRPRSLDITVELDSLGAVYNAFTSQEYTGYFAKVESHKLDQALDIVSDIYLNPVFEPVEIEKEKGVIIEELNMYEDLPMRKVHDYWMELLYGDQPAGWDVGGQKEIIKTLSKDQFLKYRGEHYLPNSTVIVVAGAFNEEEIIEKIKRGFGGMPTGQKKNKLTVTENQQEPNLKISFKKLDQAHLVLGCRAFSSSDARRYALDVLCDLLGGSMSSRLFQRVREQLGAAYYISANADLFTDHGFCAVSAGVDINRVEEVLFAILEEIKKLKNNLVVESELQKTKNHLIGKIIIGLESSDALASFYGAQEILKETIITPEELIKKVETVTCREILSLANDFFQDSKLNLAIIGPEMDNLKLKQLLHF